MGTILSLITGAFTGLFGGGSSGSNQAVVSQAIDKILPETQKEKDEMHLEERAADVKEEDTDASFIQASAAVQKDMPVIQYAPGLGLIPFFLLWILDLIDHVVDTLNHAIRPVGLVWAGLVLSGRIPVPPIQDAKMWAIFLTMVSFFYGGRMMVKDILPGILNIVQSVKK